MSYNGWTNKETWLVNLWLGDMFTEDQEEGIEISEDYIEDLVDNCVADSGVRGDSFVTDLLNCSLGEITYLAHAKHYTAGV